MCSSGTHQLRVVFCQGARPVTQVISVDPMTRDASGSSQCKLGRSVGLLAVNTKTHATNVNVARLRNTHKHSSLKLGYSGRNRLPKYMFETPQTRSSRQAVRVLPDVQVLVRLLVSTA